MKINGRGPFHFVLDTGAGITVITPQLAQTLGIGANGSSTASGTGPAKVIDQHATLRSVDLSGARQDNVAVAIVPLPPDITYQGTFGTISGLIGYSFLRDYAVSIAYGPNRVTFASKPSALADSHAAWVPLHIAADGGATVDAGIDGYTGRLQIDTGNNATSFLAHSYVIAHGLDQRYPTGFSSQMRGVGGRTASRVVRLRVLHLDSTSIPCPVFRFNAASTGMTEEHRIAGNLGYNVLRRFTVILDYPDRTAAFIPNSRAYTYEPYSITGIVPERNADGTLTVVGVLPHTPAAVAGIRAGERIVAIDGEPAQDMSDEDFARLARGNAGTYIKYMLRKGASTRDVSVTREGDMLPGCPVQTTR